jgi:predicted O-linked N-acetylglucosamine transferase (SPINDLY family)
MPGCRERKCQLQFQADAEFTASETTRSRNLTLAIALVKTGRIAEATTTAKLATALSPESAIARANLAAILHHQRRLDEAITCFRSCVTANPSNARLHSDLLFTLNYHSETMAEDLYAEAARWWQWYGEPLSHEIRPHLNTRDPERRLRIGYVSPSFCDHVVATFIEPVLCFHNRQQFEVFCYSDVSRPDQTTACLQGYAHTWRNTVALSDADLTELVRRDSIDILVDLAGHTSNNRLGVFARKPAPLQVSYLEYPSTTGLKTIDYKLTDAIADPPVCDRFYHEALLRLPGCGWCYQPPVEAPRPNALPALATGRITFGCLNNPAKITDVMLCLWAQILLSITGARLVLLYCGDLADRQTILGCFAERGVLPERIELVCKTPHQQYLHSYQRIDIGLDPFPYNGHTTTCDALWMGVPIATLSGTRHVSRVGESVLSAIGHRQLVARTPEEYVSIATSLARDLQRLRDLRSSLRNQTQHSALADGAALVKHMEAMYRDIWCGWCQR